MKCSKIVGLAAALSVAALAIGCAEVPQWEIQAAQAALDAAKKAEADRFAKGQYWAAQDSLQAAMDEINN